MRASTLPVWGLLAVLLAGCGAGTSTVTVSSPPAANSATSTAAAGSAAATTGGSPLSRQASPQASASVTLTACGTLKARFEGIGHRYDIADPQPGALHGRRVARELIAADAEALRYDHEAEAELRRGGGSAKAIVALERAERDAARLDRALHLETSNSKATGLRLLARFLRFELAQLRAVCDAPPR